MRSEGGRHRRGHLRALVQRAKVDATEVWDHGFEKGAPQALVGAGSAKAAGFGVPSSGSKKWS
jgi:site-specific DNA recombinase